MSVVEGLKIQIHVCGTYVLSVWFIVGDLVSFRGPFFVKSNLEC